MAYQDNLDSLFDIGNLEKEQNQAIQFVRNYLKEVTEASKKIQGLEFGLGGKQSLKGLQDATNGIKQASDTQVSAIKKVADAQKEAERAERERIKAVKDAATALNQYEAELARLERELKKEEAQLAKNTSAYEQLKKKYYEVSRAALDLGAKEGANSKAFLEASASAKKLHDELYKLESAVGRSHRNVGNYNGAISGLQNSVNQFSRELPAFANGLKTGFMALSNQWGQLIDDVKNYNKLNAELIAQGKPTTSVFKALTSAIFNWQTALFVGVALFTAYGDKLFQASKATQEAEKATKKYKETLDSIESSARNSANEEIARLRVLEAVATDTTKSMNSRKKAVDEMQKLYPAYLKNIEDEAILNGKAKDEINAVTEALLLKAAAAAAEKKFAAASEQVYDLTVAQRNAQKALNEETAKFNNLSKAALANPGNERVQNASVNAAKNVEKAQKALNDINQQMVKAQQEQMSFLNDAKTLGAQAFDLLTDPEKEDDPIKEYKDEKDAAEALRETLAKLAKERRPGSDKEDDNPLMLDENARNLELEKKFLEEYAKLWGDFDPAQSGVLERIQLTDEEAAALNRLLEVTTAVNKNIREDDKKTADERKKNINELINSAKAISAELLQLSSNLSQKELNKLDEELEKTERNKEAQIAAINATMTKETEKQKAIMAAENNAQANRDAIERKKLETRRKQAAFEKIANISAIITRTALAVVTQLADSSITPGWLRVGLAAAAGATGAAQLANAIAAPLPTYAEGTPEGGHPNTGPALAGEAGPEVVIEPGKTPYVVDKPTFFANMPKGTEVIPADQIAAMANSISNEYGVPVVMQQFGDNGALLNAVNGLRGDLQKQPKHITNLTDSGLVYVYERGNTKTKFYDQHF